MGTGQYLQRNLDQILPGLFKHFFPSDDPTKPGGGHQVFNDTWWNGLPMDQHINYVLEPTAFTEMWVPLKYTQEIMEMLRDGFIDGTLKTLYGIEFYGAKGSKAWLSASSAWHFQNDVPDDVLRIDIFYFPYDIQGPYDFYAQYWSRLAKYGVKLHWGKYRPKENAEFGPLGKYYRENYPRWDEWQERRQKMDPQGLFLTKYWRERMGMGYK